MKKMHGWMIVVSVVVVLALPAGCERGADHEVEHHAEAPTSVATDRIAVPAIVRKNLGITFVRAEARHVERTIRVPGCFEFSPLARREYRAMLGGRVEWHVAQYEHVDRGELLFTLDAPQWREWQERLSETESKLLQASARVEAYEPLMAAHERHHQELERVVAIWKERVQQLEPTRESGAVSDEEFARVRAALATTRADLAEVLEKEAELRSRKIEAEAERTAYRHRFELLMMNAASLLGIPTEDLTAVDPSSSPGHPRWREIRFIEVRAGAPGIVESIGVANGSWATETSLVLTTVQPEVLRFRAVGLQSDLPKFSASAAHSLSARIVPPRSPGLDISDAVDADMTLGLEAHPEERTLTLMATPRTLAPWMRAGVSAFLEVVVESSGERTLAIPRSAIVRDGLTHVYFRRDPANPDSVIRVEADMGVDDGRWVEMHSGLALGDEVVLQGAYELRLATTQDATMSKGGHFHADGTFHGEP